VMDAVHALAYKGMGIFPGDDANLPTQLWIAGRWVQSISLLVAPLFLRRALRPWLVLGVYAAVVTLLMASILGPRPFFPACYVEGAGLTLFKVISEYAVILILLASAVWLRRCRAEFDPAVLTQLTAAILMMMAGELAFTFYNDVYGVANMLGHLLRFLSFSFVYRAIIVTGLVRPYDLLFRNLARSEEALRKANGRLEATVDALKRSDERYRAMVVNSSEGICRIETGRPVPVSLHPQEQVQLLLEAAFVAECNEACARMHGLTGNGQVVGRRLAEAPPSDRQRLSKLLLAFVDSGYRLVEAEDCDTNYRGVSRCLSSSITGVVENGCLVRVWAVQRDITERKRAATERERLITELQQALAEVKTLTGLLPICAQCKKIRDDKGYWTQVESYIQQRTHASFSHGICPDCMRTLYPEYYLRT
jgi:PAS domain S-box-containing protein